jgi:ABC-type amino acid transport substrate-binding protein
MKTWLLTALLLGLGAIPGHASAQSKALQTPATQTPAPQPGAVTVVRIGILANYPPFEYSSDSGAPKGMEIELGKKYCAVAHLQCEWVTLPFTKLIPSLLDHKIDAVLAQLTITASRAAKVSFTAPVTYNAVVVLGPKGSSITDDSPTMRGIRPYEDGAKELRDLRNHTLDAVIIDQPAAYDFLREGGKFDFAFLGQPLDDRMILGAGDTAIAVRKDDGTLRNAFDAAIDTVRQDGTFEKVSAMYFPFSMEPK